MAKPAPTAADVLVIFGITGDLAKKQTFRALYRLERRKELRVPDRRRSRATSGRPRPSATTPARPSKTPARRSASDVFQRLAERLSMVSGDYQDPKTYDRVAHAIEGRHTPVFYLEIPPSLFGRVVEGLAGAGLTQGARVAVEKPFGHDLASARALNAELHKLPRGMADLPDRPLPRQGTDDGHPVPPVRQRHLRAALEPRPHPERPDHHGRGLRGGRPRELLRPGRGAPGRRAEPPAAGRSG